MLKSIYAGDSPPSFLKISHIFGRGFQILEKTMLWFISYSLLPVCLVQLNWGKRTQISK